MANVNGIYNFLNEKASFSMQMDFDNAGFLVGCGGRKVDRILVALDITPGVIEEAIEKKVQLIVSHHPVIWGSISAVTDQTNTGRRLLRLIEGGIAAICSHTNLDAAEGGVNSELAVQLGLIKSIPLHEDGMDAAGAPYGIGRVGELTQSMELEAFLVRIKESLGVAGVRVYDAGRAVHRVAVGGGACGGMLPDVIRQGCDTFVTSEVKHDVYLEAQDCGINLIDAGHYSTEALICPVLVRWLEEAFPEIEVYRAKEAEVFRFA